MEGDDDPVVEEIPVFLSQALAKQLYLFQFPTIPATNDTEINVINARIKPKSGQVAVELGIDTTSDKYSHSKGEQIALNTDGAQVAHSSADDTKIPYFRSKTMDKVIYESMPSSISADNYAVAIIQDGEMHCTPLTGIVQLRPSYSYLDHQDKHSKDSQTKATDDDKDDDVRMDTDASLITVKFADENQRDRQSKDTTLNFNSQAGVDESWIEAEWWDATTDKAEMERMKLFASANTSGSALTLPLDQYILKLVPPFNEEDANSGGNRYSSIKSLTKLTLVDQIKEILTDAKILPFPILMTTLHKAGSMASGADVVRVIGNVAVLVKGLWAARGELLYPEGTESEGGGVPAATMSRARDYVLYLLTQTVSIERRRVASVVKLPPTEILEILTSAAIYEKDIGWRLKYPPDVDFESHFPDVVQRQNIAWEARQRQFIETLNAANASAKRQRKKSHLDSTGSDAGLSSPKPRSNSVSSSGTPFRDGFNSDNDSDLRRSKNKGVGKRTKNSNFE